MRSENDFTWSTPPPIVPQVKKYPFEALPPVLKDMALAVAEHTQTAPDAAGLDALGMVSASVLKKIEVEAKPGYREPPNLYLCFVALPGERKSAVHGCMTRIGYQWEREENERLAPFIQKYLDANNVYESEITAVNKSKKSSAEKLKEIADIRTRKDALKPVKRKQHFLDDTTPESMITALCDNDECAAIVSTESVIDYIGRYTDKVNIAPYLKAHDRDPLRVNRRGREELLNAPELAILSCSQPQAIEALTKNEMFRGRGLSARFLFAFPDTKLGTRRYETAPIPPETERAYRELIVDLLNIPRLNGPRVIRLSDAAYQVHKRFCEAIEPELTERLAHITDFASKLTGAVLRIAGLLHIVQHYQSADIGPISGETMSNAVKLGWYFLSHALKTFAYTGVDERTNAAQYVVKRLTKAPGLTLSRAEIHALCRGRFDKVESLLPTLKYLVELGYMREIPTDRTSNAGRRPDSRYELNPLYFKGVE